MYQNLHGEREREREEPLVPISEGPDPWEGFVPLEGPGPLEEPGPLEGPGPSKPGLALRNWDWPGT